MSISPTIKKWVESYKKTEGKKQYRSRQQHEKDFLVFLSQHGSLPDNSYLFI